MNLCCILNQRVAFALGSGLPPPTCGIRSGACVILLPPSLSSLILSALCLSSLVFALDFSGYIIGMRTTSDQGSAARQCTDREGRQGCLLPQRRHLHHVSLSVYSALHRLTCRVLAKNKKW